MSSFPLRRTSEIRKDHGHRWPVTRRGCLYEAAPCRTASALRVDLRTLGTLQRDIVHRRQIKFLFCHILQRIEYASYSNVISIMRTRESHKCCELVQARVRRASLLTRAHSRE